MKYSFKIQMRYTDFDIQGNVNHMYYDSYIELTYLSFLRQHVNPKWHFGNIQVQLYGKDKDRHRLAILPDAKPVVEIFLIGIGHTKFTLGAKIYEDNSPETIYFQGERTLVHVKFPERKAQRLPVAYTQKIRQYFELQ